MPYSPPSVTAAGLSIPSYTDILNLLLGAFSSGFGGNVYLGTDSPDYQFISVIALSLSDAMQGIQLAYINRSPNFAIGAALDALVTLNGISRKVASASTCQVTLTGTPGAVITNGICTDVNGVKWDLPASVTIGGGGTVVTTATCEIDGAINALIGQITIIFTSQFGWTSVTNASAAILGQPVETDAQLRGRQALSVELPSITLLTGTIAAIAATKGVTRYNVVENATNATDANGNPAHSVTAVVEGGVDLDIATAIYNNRGIGPLTNPTATNPVTVSITDPSTGIITLIGFARPSNKQIFVIINAHLVTGGSSSTLTAMQAAVIAYLNSLQIGELVSYTALIAVAMGVNLNLSQPVVLVESLFLGTSASPSAVIDIPMNFNQVAQPNTITVNSI